MSLRLIVRLVFWPGLLAAMFVGDSLLRQRRPLSQLPTFRVRLIIATHRIILLRLRREATAA
jgi:hypothetical protein